MYLFKNGAFECNISQVPQKCKATVINTDNQECFLIIKSAYYIDFYNKAENLCSC